MEKKFKYFGVIPLTFIVLMVAISLFGDITLDKIPTSYHNLIWTLLSIGLLLIAMMPLKFYLEEIKK